MNLVDNFSIAHGVIAGTQTENLTRREAEDHDRTKEQKGHLSETIRGKWEKYKESEGSSAEHLVIENNEDEYTEIFCSGVEKCSGEEEYIKKMADVEKVVERGGEVRFENVGRAELKQDEVSQFAQMIFFQVQIRFKCI